jgi:cytoskeletal protein CcmA (bactofilin family)
MFQSKKINSNISSILGPEVEIRGDVNVTGDLLIYGKVFGNINSKGTVNSANGSLVKGNITAGNASISGEVQGDLDIESKVVLGKNSYLSGNLKAAIITIEEGAKFDGMCKMIQDNKHAQENDTEESLANHLSAANEQA